MTDLSTADAARRLGISPRQIHALIEQGILRAYRHGRAIRLDKDEVERLRGGDGFGDEAGDREPRVPVRPAGSAAIDLDP